MRNSQMLSATNVTVVASSNALNIAPSAPALFFPKKPRAYPSENIDSAKLNNDTISRKSAPSESSLAVKLIYGINGGISFIPTGVPPAPLLRYNNAAIVPLAPASVAAPKEQTLATASRRENSNPATAPIK